MYSLSVFSFPQPSPGLFGTFFDKKMHCMRKGQSLEARRASSQKSGPREGPQDFQFYYIAPKAPVVASCITSGPGVVATQIVAQITLYCTGGPICTISCLDCTVLAPVVPSCTVGYGTMHYIVPRLCTAHEALFVLCIVIAQEAPVGLYCGTVGHGAMYQIAQEAPVVLYFVLHKLYYFVDILHRRRPQLRLHLWPLPPLSSPSSRLAKVFLLFIIFANFLSKNLQSW